MGHYGAHELALARNAIECVLSAPRASRWPMYLTCAHTADDGSEVVEDMLYDLRHYRFNNEVHGMYYGEFASYLELFASALISEPPWSRGLEEAIERFCVMEAARECARTSQMVNVAPLRTAVGGL